MARRSLSLPGQWLQIVATIAFAAALTVLLFIGIRRADEQQSASAALQLASELSSQPQIVRSELTLIQRGLETTTYVGDSIHSIAALRDSSNQAFALLQQKLRSARLADRAETAAPFAAALRSWQSVDSGLKMVGSTRSAAALYADSAAGSELTAAGKQLKAAVDDVLATQSQSLQGMGDQLRTLGARLHTDVTNSGRSLRSLLLGGAAIAVLLLALMLYYAWRGRQSAAAAAAAQRQVANILGTVREGLFLVGRDLCLGATYSDSLTELLRLSAPAGRRFEEVLKPLVDEKTLATALKFLGLLWKDNVHEELIESINPLSQIEVSFASSRGVADVRYLAFSFRRVRGAEASGDYLLGVVADVTDRVLLARELQHMKADGDSQAALPMQLMRVDPAQLQGFLSSADVAFRKSNAMLTTPGVEQQDFQKKLNGVFRELHGVKGEAAALTLTSFVQRIHAIEDILTTLRAKPTLSGNDFLPVVVKLDDVMSHVTTIQSVQERLATFRPPAESGSGHAQTPAHGERESDASASTVLALPPVALKPPAASQNALPDLLRTLAQEVARAESRQVNIVTRGLDDVPAKYSAVIKNICIQMVRNCIVHGIESPAARAQQGKLEAGTVQISFAGDSPEVYMLTIEDDGRGLNFQKIIDKALRKGLLRPEQAMNAERRAIYAFIFQPGFSTAEQITEHAGRGVGLDAVRTLVHAQGGKIGVSTGTDKFTRFKVWLPKALASSTATSSAA